MQGLKWRSLGIIAVVLALAFGIPSFAYAEEVRVEVSIEGDVARLEGGDFAIDSFSRAQVGSNRLIEDRYFGYLYYASNGKGNLTAVVVDDFVVVYVPHVEAVQVGFDIARESDRASLKHLLIALDKQAAQGSALLSEVRNWYFTEESEYGVGDLVFRFDQELKSGQFFASVIGEDGSDVTEGGDSLYKRPDYADFGRLVSADDVVIVTAKEGLGAFEEFLQKLDFGPLWVTLKTTGVAIVFIFILGLAAAYFSLRIPARAQDVADSLFTIPMVLPPTVCGFLLLLAFGRNTGIGQWFIDIGFPLVFSWQATVLAAIVVAFPLMYRSARGAFEGLDADMLDAARTLGWSNGKIFFRLMLPLSWSSIAAGTVLAFARALGEFGATLFLAGNYAGITRTIPIAIYFEWMNGNTDVAIFWTVIIIIISFIVILFINLWGRRTTKYRRRAEV